MKISRLFPFLTIGFGLLVLSVAYLLSPSLIFDFLEYSELIWRQDVIWLLSAVALLSFLILSFGKHSVSRSFWKELNRKLRTPVKLQDNGLKFAT